MVKASRVMCITLPMVATLGVLGILVYISTAGIKEGNLDTRYFALIDTSKVRSQGFNSNGLPDSRDSNRNKDVFVINLWNYCSGHKDSNNNYRIDFCSKAGTELFDQHENWELLGYDLAQGALDNKHLNRILDNSGDAGRKVDDAANDINDRLNKAQEDLIRGGNKAITFLPKTVLGLYATALALTALQVILGLVSIKTRAASICVAIFSLISTLVLAAGAGVAQVLYSAITSGIRKIDLPEAQGRFDARTGKSVYAWSWVAVVLSAAATVCWMFTICCVSTSEKRRSRGGEREKKGNPHAFGTKLGTLVGGSRAAENTKYERLEPAEQAHYPGGQMGHMEQGYAGMQQPHGGYSGYAQGGRY